MNITDNIKPSFLIKNGESYEPVTPSRTNPLFKKFTNRYKTKSYNFISESWRQVLLGAVEICYHVRDLGYILAESTFDVDNIRLRDSRRLVFKQIFGKELAPKEVESYDDFVQVIKFIKSFFTGDVPADVKFLLLVMENENPLEWYPQAFIRCNFAFMPDAMRRSFYMRLCSSMYLSEEIKKALKRACKSLDSSMNWRRKLEKLRETDKDVFRIYSTGQNNRPMPMEQPWYLLKIIREILYHILDKPDVNFNEHVELYSPSQGFRAICCCLETEILSMQYHVYKTSLFTYEEFYRYRPSAM